MGERWPLFWAGCVAISAGVLLHLPMLSMAQTMGNHLSGMPMDGWMYLGIALIAAGVSAAIIGVLPTRRPTHDASPGVTFEAPDGIVRKPPRTHEADACRATPHQRQLTFALVTTALAWSFVNFGLLLWLPTDLQDRGFSAEIASGIIASSALVALPTIVIAAVLYSRWSSKRTLIGTVLLTLAGLAGALLPARILAWPPLLVAVIALLVVGTNGLIAVLLPYAAENYALGVRGRATGLIAASSKFGGVAVQLGAFAGLIPTLGGAALALLFPMGLSAVLIGRSGRETQGRSLRDLEAGV